MWRFHSVSTTLAVALALPLGAAARAQAAADEPPALSPAIAVDRLSLALTGLPAESADKKAFLDGAKSYRQLADEMRTRPGFFTRVMHYWQQVLGTQTRVTFHTIKDPKGRNEYDRKPGRWLSHYLYKNHGVQVAADPLLTAKYHQRLAVHTRYFKQHCPQAYWFLEAYPTIPNDPATYSALQDYTICYHEATPTKDLHCACDRLVPVRPFWDPTETISVAPAAVTPEKCGADLSQCFIEIADEFQANLQHPYIDKLSVGFSEEPAAFVAKAIQEDRPYDVVATGTSGVANGAMLNFLKIFYERGLEHFQPPGSYPDRHTDPKFTTVAPTDTAYHWVERGPLHAGVLTTLAFHRATTGWRAKVNRVYNALLCRQFKQIESVPAEGSAEQDLTKRPGCADCHRVLEPASGYWGRWPNSADANYYYDATATADGDFAGAKGQDTVGLGRVLVGMDDYWSCGVKRSFEMLVGRAMNEEEVETMLPRLTRQLAKDKMIWPVMREIIDSPSFRGVGR